MEALDRARRGRVRIREVVAGAGRRLGLRGPAPVMATVVFVSSGMTFAGVHAAHVRVTPHDRVATRAFLTAEYSYLRSQIAAEPATQAASERAAAALGAECPGVLAGAPHAREFEEGLFGEEEQHLSARQRGEHNRTFGQVYEIEFEFGEALSRAGAGANRAGALAYAHTLQSLHWSSATLTQYEHYKARALLRGLNAPQPAVCADMKAWVASGYTKLSPGTKALIGEIFPSELALLRALQGGVRPDAIVAAYETSGERELLRRIRRVKQQQTASLIRSEGTLESLGKPLGIHSYREESEEPPKGGIVIARGSTAAGGSYTIWVQTQHPPRDRACSIDLGIHASEGSGSSTSESCVAHGARASLRAHCNGSGWQVEGQTREGATSVSVKLRDGSQVSSPVALVPPNLGGPAGFFFQVFGKSQAPVSASELNAQGTVLGTVELPHEAKCPNHLFSPPKEKPPEPLPSRKLASGRLPHGGSFEILAFRDRYDGHIETTINAAVLSPRPFVAEVFGSVFESGPEPRSHSPIKLRKETGCGPPSYALLYGLLKAPGDTVLARTPHGLEPFRIVRPPASLHLHGVLAYIPLSVLPSEVIVRAPDGRTVFRKSYRRKAREIRETCEGEAEP